MLSLKEFKKLTKSEVLNSRYIVGGGVATEYDDNGYRDGDDWYYNDGKVGYSHHVPRGGTPEADPKP